MLLPVLPTAILPDTGQEGEDAPTFRMWADSDKGQGSLAHSPHAFLQTQRLLQPVGPLPQAQSHARLQTLRRHTKYQLL